jgi:membrane-bound lytic murein transglycosylase B
MPPREKHVPPEEMTRPLRRGPHPGTLAVLILLLFGFILPGPAAADWNPLVERLATDGFNRQAVENLFARPEVRFEPDAMAGKLKALLRSRSVNEGPIDESLRTAVRRDYLGSQVIARARSYQLENSAVLKEISNTYGVPQEIVVSILLIETHLGRNTGNQRVFNRLASMALCTDLETVRPHLGGAALSPDDEAFARRRSREKADWAYNELKALLRLAEKDGLDPLGIRGSIYGAIGQCQFMPSNVFTYGVDADQDGRIDPFAKHDALHSIANYLRGHGWQAGMDRAGQYRVIFKYNHSTVYANTVLAVAEKLRNRSRKRQ